MTNKDLLDLGFKEIGHFTIGNSVHLDLGRGRFLSASSVGTPNEMIFMCKVDEEDPKKVTDAICLHNWDYDGHMTLENITNLISALTNVTKERSSIH